MRILTIEKLSKTYQTTSEPALDEISFSVREGDFISIIGPSGAGKSTLLRTINRLVEPTSGYIHFDGDDVATANKRELRRIRTKIGMVFQHYNLVDRSSAIENVLHGTLGSKGVIKGSLGIYSKEEKEKAFQLLADLGILEHAYKRCDELSGGQKQRVGIARTLMQEPRILLCGESDKKDGKVKVRMPARIFVFFRFPQMRLKGESTRKCW